MGQEAVRATEVKSHPEQTIFPRHRFEMASQKIAFVLFTLVIVSGLLTTMTDAFSSQTNMGQGKAQAVNSEFSKRGVCGVCNKYCKRTNMNRMKEMEDDLLKDAEYEKRDWFSLSAVGTLI